VLGVRDRLSVSKFLNLLHHSALDASYLRKGDYGIDHCLVVVEVRDRLSTNKLLNFLYTSALDTPYLRRGDCDTDQCLVVAEDRERLSGSKFLNFQSILKQLMKVCNSVCQ
jgi:hypothetical protein